MLDSFNKNQKYVSFLLFIFSIVWIFAAISPFSRHDWMLENMLVIIIISVLSLTYKKFVFSNTSYTLIAIFMIVHEIGAHYTYSLVPYEEWLNACCNWSLNAFMGWERNNFDRSVHLLFGLVWVYPAKEFLERKLLLSNGLSWFFAVQSVMTFSLLYELIEWGVAMIFGGKLGMEYLGTQGDIWDAHKDMLLAALGGLIPALLFYKAGQK
jgi:putative membrane protein